MGICGFFSYGHQGTICSGSRNIYFSFFIFYVLFGMLLKGMGERFLLFKDEPLTPDIDGVMALWFFRNRAQNTKIGQKLAKIGPLDRSFYLFAPAPSFVVYWSQFSKNFGTVGVEKKTLVQ